MMDEDAVLGEIRLWAGVFEPAGWTYCDGRVLSISASSQGEAALFALIKSNFGGDGTTTFALPKLADIELNNAALFSLLEATYGGDGIHNFALPQLPALVPAKGRLSSTPSAATAHTRRLEARSKATSGMYATTPGRRA